MLNHHNCMKPRWAVFAATCAAALVGASAFGGISHTYEDNDATLVVNVDSGSETMVDTWVTSPDSTTGATVTKIKKTGAGTLVAVPIPTFTGDFSIEAGVYSYLQVGDFGATNATASAGVIDIKEGAKILHMSASSSPPASEKGVLTGKTLNLYGGTTPNTEASTRCYGLVMGENMTIVLKANAIMSMPTWGRPVYKGTIDLGEHTLTIEGHESLELVGTVVNPGKILVTGALITDNGLVLDDTSTGRLEVAGGAFFLRRVTVNGWTLGVADGRVEAFRANSAWEGPIEISGESSKMATTQSQSPLVLKGPISGEGKLQIGPKRLDLYNSQNTYSGKVTVLGSGNPSADSGIGICDGAACFPYASTIAFTNGASIGFMDDVAASVPELTFVGDATQSIFGGTHTNRSTIAGITKTGSGTLVVDAPVHVTGATTVSGGTLKVPFGTRVGTLGLYEQYCAISNSYNWSRSRAPGDPDVYSGFSPWDAGADMLREQVDLGVNKDGAVRCYHQYTDAGWGWPSSKEGTTNTKNYYWYHGYVWNHSDSPVTWKLLSGMYPSTYVWFGEDHGTTMVFDNNTHTAVPQEVTLQPGPTRIDIAIWGWGGDQSGGYDAKYDHLRLSYAVNTTWACEEWDPANPGSKRDDFVLFAQGSITSDVGDDTLFTADVYGENDEPLKVATLPVFDNLVFSAGAVLDLSSNTVFQVANLTGSPLVTNAPVFKVTNNWTICAADFPKADSAVRNPMVVDGQLVFTAGTTFSIDDEKAIVRSGVVVATATGGVQGRPVAAPGFGRWWLVVDGNSVELCRGGLTIVVR